MKTTFSLLLRSVPAIVLATLVTMAQVFAAAGDLDPTFASAGSVSPYAPPGLKRFLAGSPAQSLMTAATLQSDGRILTASWCGIPAGGFYDFCLNRLLSDGSFDASFGTSGFASTSGGEGYPSGIAVDTRNDIWVSGSCASYGCVHKFSSSGGHYINVGVNGRVTVPGMYDISSVAASGDGKIVVGGRCVGTPIPPLPPNTAIYYPCVARLNLDGTMDATFNSGVIRQWGDDPFTGAMLRDGQTIKLVVRPDGRIYAANMCDLGSQAGTTANKAMCLAIIEANGSISPIYFGPGDVSYFYVTYFANTTMRLVADMAVQSDGAAVLTGSCLPTAGGTVGCSTRIIPDVGVDQGFGVNGVLTTTLGFGSTSIGGVLLREDGSMVMAAQCIVSIITFQHEGICLAAYNSSGAPLGSFSGGASTRLIDIESSAPHSVPASVWRGGRTLRVGSGGSSAFLTYGGCLTNVPVYNSCIAKISLAETSGKSCSADLDGNGAVNATSDGLMLMRALLGLSGTAVTQGVAAPGAPRATWPAVRDFLGAHCDLAVAP